LLFANFHLAADSAQSPAGGAAATADEPVRRAGFARAPLPLLTVGLG